VVGIVPSEDSNRSFGAVVGLGMASELEVILGVEGEVGVSTEESDVETGVVGTDLVSKVTVVSVGRMVGFNSIDGEEGVEEGGTEGVSSEGVEETVFPAAGEAMGAPVSGVAEVLDVTWIVGGTMTFAGLFDAGGDLRIKRTATMPKTTMSPSPTEYRSDQFISLDFPGVGTAEVPGEGSSGIEGAGVELISSSLFSAGVFSSMGALSSGVAGAGMDSPAWIRHRAKFKPQPAQTAA